MCVCVFLVIKIKKKLAFLLSNRFYSPPRTQNVNTTLNQKKIFFLFLVSTRAGFCLGSFLRNGSPCITRKQHDKQVQGGSVPIIEPGTLFLPKTKALCVKF